MFLRQVSHGPTTLGNVAPGDHHHHPVFQAKRARLDSPASTGRTRPVVTDSAEPAQLVSRWLTPRQSACHMGPSSSPASLPGLPRECGVSPVCVLTFLPTYIPFDTVLAFTC